ncbi:SusC/RagA family TonB-linked outer membrane protein [uncultured Pedobacter sp.]|uniref:SusC/RagA family TonB-linked outer membrane protein n=2 Tax=Pedobacter TaxID=84567 RepID=UPI002606AFF4|nr:SusC/RagA family TonB-linked outer membrane protein [uncultured Pedobacter sp.]
MRVNMIIIIMTSCLANIYASGFAQTVTLKEKNLSLEDAFMKIRHQTGYDFIFDAELLKQSHRINIEIKNATIETSLLECLEGQNLTFEIKDRSVTIKKKISAEKALIYIAKIDIKGKVVDEKGNPLEGASIRLRGTTTVQTVTNAKGEFALNNVDDKSTLLISYIGYKTVEIDLKNNKGPFNISLEIAENKIEEVEITTGIFKKVDKSFTGSSLTVSAKQLQEFGNRNLLISLRNIDPAFNIIESNNMGSDPNRLPDIQIRGNSSLPNIDNLDNLVGLNTPLVILDGFQSTLQRLLDINVNEVESLTILKDASATAIYGSRGANGVIVITTKLPMQGALRIGYRNDTNFEIADLSDYNLLNAREKLDLEKSVGLYNNSTIEQDINLKKYYNYLLSEINEGVNTDWLAAPLRVGVGQRHNLSFSGGVPSFRYSASAQINNIAGVMKGSGRNTFNGTINLAYQLKNIRLNNQTIFSEGRFSESQYGSFGDYAKMNPYWRAYDTEGNVLKALGDPGENYYTGRWYPLPTNPLYNATLNGFNKTKNSEVINNTSVEWTIFQGFILRAQLGLGKTTVQQDAYRPADHTAFANYSTNDIFRKGDYQYNITNGFNYDGALNIQYSKRFKDKHLLYSGVDFNIRHRESSMYGFLAEGFSNPKFDFISMALQYAQGQKPTGSESRINALGLTANVNYIYNDRYFTDVSIRMDGSSQFGTKKRIAPFWSWGLGWNLHNEDFLKNSKVINRLKLRGSTGVTGSQNFSAYQALSTYRYYTDKRYFNLFGAYLLAMGNEDLKWQQTLNYDVGIDAEFFNNRLKLTADYYTSTTRDIVSSISIPASTGFTNYVENIGRMKNKGFEVRATGVLIDQGRRKWYASVTAGVAQNKNTIISISQAMKDAQKSRQMAQQTTPSSLFVEGYSTNTIWVVPSLGIDPSNGKEVYLDLNGQPTYEWSGNNLRAMGNTDPNYIGNFSFLVRYKGFTLNTSFGYRLGGQIYNQTSINKVENVDYKYNVDRRVYENRWTKPGDLVQFKSKDITATTFKTSRFVEDENTLICQNIYLQYEILSASFKQKLKIQQVQLTVNADQPFRISSVKQERGIIYPFSRQLSFGVNVTF